MAALTPEEEAQIVNAQRVIDELRKKAGGGGGGGGGGANDLTQRQKDAKEFDELSKTGGLTELFSSDRARFDRLQQAKQTLGEADLVHGKKVAQIP